MLSTLPETPLFDSGMKTCLDLSACVSSFGAGLQGIYGTTKRGMHSERGDWANENQTLFSHWELSHYWPAVTCSFSIYYSRYFVRQILWKCLEEQCGLVVVGSFALEDNHMNHIKQCERSDTQRRFCENSWNIMKHHILNFKKSLFTIFRLVWRLYWQ